MDNQEYITVASKIRDEKIAQELAQRVKGSVIKDEEDETLFKVIRKK